MESSAFELMGYSYQVIVTNIENMSAEEVWRFYNGRANVENMIKEGILGYCLDVNVLHFYGANVAHFHLVMLAYNLMNLFKELVLEQKEKKRMGKWIRQRFLLIAGKLVSSGRRFILKLQEDWAYKDEYKEADRRLEDWLRLHNREEKEKEGKRKMENNPSVVGFAQLIEKA